jgi:DNA polymerase-3 subunit delta'
MHLDFSLIQPESGSKVVRIEQVRSLQDWAWISPSEGRAKTVLVFGADTITEEAANSFLKLLEEPPPKLTLILVSDFPHRLLDTVRSRCALFSFHPIPSIELEGWLRERRGLEADRARLIAGLSEGRPGLATHLAEEGSISVRKPLLGELEILLNRGFLALPGVAARSLRIAGGLRPALEGLLLLLRDGIVASDPHEPADRLLGSDLAEPLRRIFGGVSRAALLGAAEAVAKGLDITRHLYIPSDALVLETVLADVGVALRKTG